VFSCSAGTDSSRDGPEFVDDRRGGFVLALVVLLLFGIGVAGAAGYQIVFSEALLSVHAKETQTALSIARAGLRFYMGKQIGVHDDTVTYSMEGGDAVVTARLVAKVNNHETLYLLSSEGVYTDPTVIGSPARRIVHQYATKREVAVDHMAALTQATGDVRAHNGTLTTGIDQAASGDCEQTQTDIIGIVMGSGSLQIDGAPNVTGSSISLNVGSMATVLDSLNLDWDLLTNASFPVDYEGVLPDFGVLPADSFPVIRYNGNLTAGPSESGRGVLIVKNVLTVVTGWSWQGVILTGYFFPPNDPFLVEGVVVSGLDGLSGFTDIRRSSQILYNRCLAFQAARSLSHFESVGGTWWEEM